MSLLASAGIYLVLDVNSPRPGEALNRYEPWTTYGPYYLDHVLRIVHQFSGYNNTLGFFAGNEIVNNEVSARESPPYIKAVVRDMHKYMKLHSPRQVPVGYSAADDLRYRISLSKYLECGEPGTNVDFYGVNSYQWCGHQTFESSGYDTLVENYADYSLPIFFSEFGCNAVTPRMFQEIDSLYSRQMTSVFSGGLVYEYAQGNNKYGLVKIAPDGSAHMLADFDTLQRKYQGHDVYYDFSQEQELTRPVKCKAHYAHLTTNHKLPDTPIPEMLQRGLVIPHGKFVDVRINATRFKIFDPEQNEIKPRQVKRAVDIWAPAATPADKRPIQKFMFFPPKLPLMPLIGGGRQHYRGSTVKANPSQSPKNSKTSSTALVNKKANSSSVLMFSDNSLKLLLGSIIVGGPLAGLIWFSVF
jgi:hypothetical protein